MKRRKMNESKDRRERGSNVILKLIQKFLSKRKY